MSSEVKFNLAILASGTGSNADKICTYFKDHPHIQVRLIISNNLHAGVLDIALSHEIDSLVIPRADWKYPGSILPALESKKITHIILAGFLLLIPNWLVNEYRGRILNIHPALLPKHGGKGMYGMHVHRSVKEAGELVSGITIHEVDERYDEGDIVFQEKTSLDPNDTAKDIASKVLRLEHYHFPRVIEKWVYPNAKVSPSH